jgi:hypothetical protein
MRCAHSSEVAANPFAGALEEHQDLVKLDPVYTGRTANGLRAEKTPAAQSRWAD